MVEGFFIIKFKFMVNTIFYISFGCAFIWNLFFIFLTVPNFLPF